MAFQVPEDVFDRIELEKYGVGVPAVIGLVALALFWRAIPGLTIFYQMTVYGKFGVIVMVVASFSLLWTSGYTYRAVDKNKWLLTEEEDKTPLIEDDD